MSNDRGNGEGANAGLDQSTRFALPYPIACLYRLRNSRHEAAARVALSYRLAEGVARFIALVGLADVVGRVPVRERKHLFKAIYEPGFGKLLWLVKETHGPLAGDTPFLQEVRRLDDAWWTALDALNKGRNRFAHDDYHVPESQARDELPEVELRIQEILRGIGFLRDYRLGQFQGVLKKGSNRVRAQWYCSRGLEETEPPVEVTLSDWPFERVMTLIDVRDGRALALAPFFIFGRCDNEAGEHLMLLQRRAGVVPGVGGDKAWVYRHPAERWETTSLLVLAGEDKPIDDKGFIEHADSWPSTLTLGMTTASLGELNDRKKPAFDERYRVLGALGVGAMGTVWQAEDTELKRLCALKVIHPHLMVSADSRARFKREATALARLDHAGIVRVFDTDRTTDGSDVIVMEFCDGESLQNRLSREGALPPATAVAIVEQILDALAHAHERNVVHRDIKPDNVMLTNERARVIDFGIAAFEDATHATRTSQQLGTLGFIAPEYIAGNRPTPAVDVYAVGKLWQVALTAKPARLGDESGIELLAPGLATVLRGSLATDPTRRFPDAATMLRALRDVRPAALATPVARAAPPSVAPRPASPPATLVQKSAPASADDGALEVADASDVVDLQPVAPSDESTANATRSTQTITQGSRTASGNDGNNLGYSAHTHTPSTVSRYGPGVAVGVGVGAVLFIIVALTSNVVEPTSRNDPPVPAQAPEASPEVLVPARPRVMAPNGGVEGALDKNADRDAGMTQGEPVVLGALDPEIIRGIVREHADQIRYCYESELTRTPGISGEIIMKLVINGDGKVTQASTAETQMKSANVEGCLATKIKTWIFPKPKGGGIVIVNYPFVFKQSEGSTECDPVLDLDCKLPRGDAKSPAPSKATLEKSDVLAVVARSLPSSKRCGAKYNGTGTIMMSWNISKSGRPTDVSVNDSNRDTPVGDCVTDVVRAMKFPAYSGAAPLPVSIPLPLR